MVSLVHLACDAHIDRGMLKGVKPQEALRKKSLPSFPCFDNVRNMETKDVVIALSALAQASRLAVFRALVQAGPAGLAAGKISEMTGIPPSSLSFHLKELSHAGLVSSEQAGRFVIYTAGFDAMNALVGFLTENCCGGNPCTPVCAPACNPEKSTPPVKEPS